MSYRFEMHFSGLCLFHVADDARSMQVHLVNATNTGTSCENDIELPKHRPELVFDLSEVRVDKTPEELEQRFCCTNKGSIWSLPLLEWDFKLELAGAEDFCVKLERKNREREPRMGGVTLSDFGWVASLKKIDKRLEGLKPQVKESVQGNPLVTSRVRINKGKVETAELGNTRRGPLAIWDVRPDEDQVDHPKALAEAVAVRTSMTTLPVVLRDEARDAALRFEPRAGRLVLRVRNLPRPGSEKPKVGSSHPHPSRLRHFLWYWELVKWTSRCPETLVAPTCPRGDCRRGGSRDVIGEMEAGNHFCPPATYP